MRKIYILLFSTMTVVFLATTGMASPPRATIEYQPMTSQGLAAGYPFEAWVVFDRSSNPAEPGYALPAGASFRFTFPPAFTPKPGIHPESVLLYGWPQKAAPVPFAVGLDPAGSTHHHSQTQGGLPRRPARAPWFESDPPTLGSTQSCAGRRLSDHDRDLGCQRIIWDHTCHRPHYLQASTGRRCLQSTSRGSKRRLAACENGPDCAPAGRSLDHVAR